MVGGLLPRTLFGPSLLIAFLVMWEWICFVVVSVVHWGYVLEHVTVSLWCRFNVSRGLWVVAHVVARVVIWVALAVARNCVPLMSTWSLIFFAFYLCVDAPWVLFMCNL